MALRDEHLTMRVTAAEKAYFKQAAEAERLQVGDWLRRLGTLRAVELGVIAPRAAVAKQSA